MLSKLTYSRGKISKICNCPNEAVRHYERIGLLSKPQRSRNGYRVYTEAQLMELQIIVFAKRMGFTNQEIRDLLILLNEKQSSRDLHFKSQIARYIDAVGQKISDLRKIEQSLLDISNHSGNSKAGLCACGSLLTLFDREANVSDQDEVMRGNAN